MAAHVTSATPRSPSTSSSPDHSTPPARARTTSASSLAPLRSLFPCISLHFIPAFWFYCSDFAGGRVETAGAVWRLSQAQGRGRVETLTGRMPCGVASWRPWGDFEGLGPCGDGSKVGAVWRR
eukprot:3848801-Rhodomonas_salina.1